ncbi:uncharacterized protein LOC112349719 isoform X1 [Selaginella moellendorffii]|uniref:uncharacterized protein LOC112349719 isoform X1 n=1 Tax=Selaginella moellendorffii TaxID=88036 RepID=UPI000D1C911C|nr:uncharacterized protein LOC112349719 isoform X1 [Selaginella moellendorffii]XP_024540418.1 uncharacterized protein LOC112349719 isoform X1 [Selaginella moellendorffii]XP_024540424.1 uncharacterized protein LOC112349719 isoform X1 [Selaginella moellendorffii]XP_024540430.1 uncharacterized protein LOC112349719 isoform X1 [Selaginella moellendorffii]XP_024540436.1 uncharacterized protein LOC112349719 isoform X1 [Selaginella moellendorffii]|eukprot:XP_024540413.1 uncharacterized protein LOC112349719 isoform X1 [Selaginella moellendorffii]
MQGPGFSRNWETIPSSQQHRRDLVACPASNKQDFPQLDDMAPCTLRGHVTAEFVIDLKRCGHGRAVQHIEVFQDLPCIVSLCQTQSVCSSIAYNLDAKEMAKLAQVAGFCTENAVVNVHSNQEKIVTTLVQVHVSFHCKRNTPQALEERINAFKPNPRGLFKPIQGAIQLANKIFLTRKAVRTSNWCSSRSYLAASARITRTEVNFTTGEYVSMYSKPGIWLNPRATNLALNFATVPSGLYLTV